VLFGGNVSRTVAGSWRTSDELILVKFPTSGLQEVEVREVAQNPSGPWPGRRWGASLTTLESAKFLTGGWGPGVSTALWALRLREAAAHWTKVQSSCVKQPPEAAFHTATAVDSKRFAMLGGLTHGGTRKGLWTYNSDENMWSQMSSEGPSCAGHAAGVVDKRLVFFGGVERGGSLTGDTFRQAVSVFDLRKNKWDSSWSAPHGMGPVARRNPAYATLGRHLIITGGFDDQAQISRSDSWALDMSRGVWRELHCPGAPALEGHKAVVSGFDMLTFGGHSGPGQYPSRSMSVYALSFRADGDGLSVDATSRHSLQDDSDDSGDSSSSDEAVFELPNGQRIPVQLFQSLQRAASQTRQ